MKEHNYYVYILAKRKNGTFYTGVTGDLIKRIYEHKEEVIKGYTKKYNVKMLVYYEHHTDINEAIKREKLIKKWKRSYKVNAIEKMNPEWDDLYFELVGADPANQMRGDMISELGEKDV